MANKRILICSDSKSRLDRVHAWFNLSPAGYMVTRGDGLERAKYQYETAGPVRFNLVVNVGLAKDGGEEWIDQLYARGQAILELKEKIDLRRPLDDEEDPIRKRFLTRVAELLGT